MVNVGKGWDTHMPTINFRVDNGELRFRGIARYWISSGCQGDRITPSEPKHVEDVKVLHVCDIHERRDVIWWDVTAITSQAEMLKAVNESDWCMEQIREQCEAEMN